MATATRMLLVLAFIVPPAGWAGADPRATLDSGGRSRTYLVHLPAGYSAAQRWPLVIALHGRTQNGEGGEKITHLDEFADRDHVDDVGFVSALLDRLIDLYAIDRSRIYATGGSNGGVMALRLACDLATRFAAVAAVIATVPVLIAPKCHPGRPLALLEINGTSDHFYPYAGGNQGTDGGLMLSAEDSVGLWARLDACQQPGERDTVAPLRPGGQEIRRLRYSGCAQGVEVVLISIVGMGHTWPGGVSQNLLFTPFIGRVSHDLDANQVIWDFFKTHAFAPAAPTAPPVSSQRPPSRPSVS